ncbi:unnamed protein product, partial [Meganyctiphanes norvegica]
MEAAGGDTDTTKENMNEEAGGIEDESTEESEDEEEEEPKLKYERISGDLREILKRDGASCIAANSKLMIIGTNWGRVHVMDHQGNKVKEFAPHSGPVTMIDMDMNGDYIASCSHDRKVSIQGLYTSDNSHMLTMDVPVRCVALDPFYFKPRSGRRFIVGDIKITLYEKALFGQLRSTVLSEGGGPARAMRWRGQFLAWATDSGVRVMDMNNKTVITLIKRDHSLALPCEQYPPHLCWQDDLTLLVGWGDSIKVCRVRERSTPPQHMTQTGLDLPPFYVEIVYLFTTDFYVCGLGPLEQHVAVLAYNKQETSGSSGTDWRRPQMRVLEPLQGTYQEISKDVLGIRCFQEYKPANYHLECLVEERQFYIVCPQDVVLAKPRDADDRVQWLLQHNRYSEALEVVKNCRDVQKYNYVSVGRMYLEHLMGQGSYQEAVQLCTQILGTDKALWEEAVVRFNRVRQLRVLSPALPLGEGVRLDPTVYQTVLLDLLQNDHQVFLQIVQHWPGNLYNVAFIINAVLETLARNTNNLVLLQALAHLYSNIDKHDKALAIYLKLKHKDVFSLIARHNLYACVAKHIVDLMSLDVDTALDVCCQHINIIQPDSVVRSLEMHTEFLYKYLNALYERNRDLSCKYHSRLVTLYADLDRSKLLPLLLTSSSYDLSQALEVCRARCLTTETIHLLDRMGDSVESLRLILEEEHDIQWAINLCKEHDDHDLWNHLINYTIDKPGAAKNVLSDLTNNFVLLLSMPSKFPNLTILSQLMKIMQPKNFFGRFHFFEKCQIVTDNVNLVFHLLNGNNSGITHYGDDIACVKPTLRGHKRKLPRKNLGVFRPQYWFSCMPEDFKKIIVCLAGIEKILFLMI